MIMHEQTLGTHFGINFTLCTESLKAHTKVTMYNYTQLWCDNTDNTDTIHIYLVVRGCFHFFAGVFNSSSNYSGLVA